MGDEITMLEYVREMKKDMIMHIDVISASLHDRMDVMEKSITDRLDKQNGRIGKNEEAVKEIADKIVPDGKNRVAKIEEDVERLDRRSFWLAGVVVVGGPVLFWALKALAEHLGIVKA